MYIEESVMGHITIITAVFLVCWGYVWVKEKLTNKRKYRRIIKWE